MPNKQLIGFYLGTEPCPNGAYLREILDRWSDDELENCHDYIQWMFPTVQRSQFNKDAPMLDDETIAAFKESALLRPMLVTSLERMCKFYGLQIVQNVSPPQIVKAVSYPERKANWQEADHGCINHNLLRLTRIIDSLVIFGLPQYGAALYRCLESIAAEEPMYISEKTVLFWRDAAVRKFQFPTRTQLERQTLADAHVCPEQIDRVIWSAENAAELFEKRKFAFSALDLVDRLGNSEVTEGNLTRLRRVLQFMSQKCDYNFYELKDVLQPVQYKLEPGYEMATDMFEALYTGSCQFETLYAKSCRFQLDREEDYGFALTCALLALRASIKLDVKRQIMGSDNKSGINKALLLVADVYERINDTKRCAEVRSLANKIEPSGA